MKQITVVYTVLPVLGKTPCGYGLNDYWWAVENFGSENVCVKTVSGTLANRLRLFWWHRVRRSALSICGVR